MAKMKGLGASLKYLPTYSDVGTVKTVGSLVSIGEIAPTSDEIDATTLDSANGYREFIQGFRDAGELAITGYHDKADTGQTLCRTLFGSGASGYWWVTFSDGTVVAFTAYLKGYSAGAADVDGLVGFGATLRISGAVQIIEVADAIAQTKAVNATATLVSTAYVNTGAPTYQWKTCADLQYGTPANVVGGSGGTTASYTTPALTPAGTKYYFCTVTVANQRPVDSQIHVITVTP